MTQFALTAQDYYIGNPDPFKTLLQQQYQLSLQTVVFRKATDGQHSLVIVLPDSENRKWETLAAALRSRTPQSRIEPLSPPTTNENTNQSIYLALNHAAAATLAQQCDVTLSPEGCPPPRTYAPAVATAVPPRATMPPETMLRPGVSVLQMTQPPGQPMQPVPVQMQQPLPAQQQQQYQQPPMQAAVASVATPPVSPQPITGQNAYRYYSALSAYFPLIVENFPFENFQAAWEPAAQGANSSQQPGKILIALQWLTRFQELLTQKNIPYEVTLADARGHQWVKLELAQFNQLFIEAESQDRLSRLKKKPSDIGQARRNAAQTEQYKFPHIAHDLTLLANLPVTWIDPNNTRNRKPLDVTITCATCSAAEKLYRFIKQTLLDFFPQGSDNMTIMQMPLLSRELHLSTAAFDALKEKIAPLANAHERAQAEAMVEAFVRQPTPPLLASVNAAVAGQPPLPSPPPAPHTYDPTLRSPQGLQAPAGKSSESQSVNPDLLLHILTIAQASYSTWVTALHRDGTAEGAGIFSRFRHGQGGIDRVQAMLNDFSGTTDGGGHRGKLAVLARYFHAQDAQTNRSFFQPRLGTNAHNHSFISFFLNALKEAHQQANSGSAEQQAIAQIITKDLGLDLTDVLKNNSFTTSAAEKDRRDALNKIKAELVGCVERPAHGKKSGM